MRMRLVDLAESQDTQHLNGIVKMQYILCTHFCVSFEQTHDWFNTLLFQSYVIKSPP